MSRRGENIHKRKDGRWEARYEKGRNDNGAIIYGFLYGKSYREAKEKKIQALRQKQPIQNKYSIAAVNIRELSDSWLTSVQYTLKESTYMCYTTLIQKHIIVYFSENPQQLIDKNVLQLYYNSKILAGLSQRTVKTLISTVENVLLLLIFANLISVLLYPNGVYEYFMPNQWGGGEVDRQWILEQKNSFSYYCIILLAASSIRCSAVKMKIVDGKWILEYLICIASVVISKSSTGTIVLMVELIYLVLYRLIGRENRFNSKFMTLAISCVYIIFVTGNTALFGNVIYALTGKSSDLSTRLLIWKNSFDYISQHPIIGGGYTFGDEFQRVLGNLHFSSTHNMVVQIMFYGGIVLLAVFIYMVVHLVKNASIIKEQKIAYAVFGIVLMILIEGLTESLVGSVKIYILLQILISFTESEILYEKEVENGGAE